MRCHHTAVRLASVAALVAGLLALPQLAAPGSAAPGGPPLLEEQTPVLSGIVAASARLADVTGDGRADLVGVPSGSTNALQIRPGDGAGGFGPARSTTLGWDLRRYELLDLDGTAHLDVVAFGSAGTISVSLGGPGGWTRTQEYDLPLTCATGVTAGDVTQDGVVDLVFVGCAVNVLAGLGGGVFAAAEKVSGESAQRPVVADVTGDGLNDIVAGYVGEFYVLPALAGGGFAGTATWRALRGFSGERFEVVDIERDGDLDVLSASFSDVAVQPNSGNGVFGAARSSFGGSDPQFAGSADFNGDGALDAVGYPKQDQGDVDRFYFYDGLGDGHFEAYAYGSSLGPLRNVLVARLDADARPDVLLLSDAAMAVRLNRGQAVLPTATPTPSSPTPSPTRSTSPTTSPTPTATASAPSASPATTAPTTAPATTAPSAPTAGPTSPTVSPNPSPTTAPPSPVPAPTTGPAEPRPEPGRAPTLLLSRDDVPFGTVVTVTIVGTPGDTVDLSTRLFPNTGFRPIREALVLDSRGIAEVATRPNHNLRFSASSRSSGLSGNEPLVRVAKTVSLNATRKGPGTYTFSGSAKPANPGQVVHLYRDGRLFRARVPVRADGAYSFTGTSAAGTFTFRVVSPETGYNRTSAFSRRVRVQ